VSRSHAHGDTGQKALKEICIFQGSRCPLKLQRLGLSSEISLQRGPHSHVFHPFPFRKVLWIENMSNAVLFSILLHRDALRHPQQVFSLSFRMQRLSRLSWDIQSHRSVSNSDCPLFIFQGFLALLYRARPNNTVCRKEIAAGSCPDALGIPWPVSTLPPRATKALCSYPAEHYIFREWCQIMSLSLLRHTVHIRWQNLAERLVTCNIW